MATVIFHPELSTDNLDNAVLLSISFIGENTNVYGEPERIQLKAGINRDINDTYWQQAKGMDHIKQLFSTGALREDLSDRGKEEVITPMSTIETLENLSLEASLQLISDCHEPEQLEKWRSSGQRVRVRNACVRRRNELLQGND